MFIGEYQHSIDTKGRIILPSKFREGLGDNFVATKGLDNCLFVYTQSEWKVLEEKVKQLPLSSIEARRFVRFFFAGAAICEFDGQFRTSVPQNLREYAGLSKEIVSIGVSNRVEIWDKLKWQEYNNESNFVDNELAAKMAELGI